MNMKTSGLVLCYQTETNSIAIEVVVSEKPEKWTHTVNSDNMSVTSLGNVKSNGTEIIYNLYNYEKTQTENALFFANP